MKLEINFVISKEPDFMSSNGVGSKLDLLIIPTILIAIRKCAYYCFKD